MYRIRFNLGRGENYLKWKVVHIETKEVSYYDPDDYQLVIKNCVLVNKKAGAERIFNGHNKYVVAWIMCDSLEVRDHLHYIKDWMEHDRTLLTNFLDKKEILEVFYNPRVKPNWVFNEGNADGYNFPQLTTRGRRLFYEVPKPVSDRMMAAGMALHAKARYEDKNT